MTRYRVTVRVVEVRGYCAAGYKPGDEFVCEWFYVKPNQELRLCLHALNSMMTVLTALLKGYSARDLGIGEEDDIGYVQCPDPGKPYTRGGTIVFELRRETLHSHGKTTHSSVSKP